MEEVREQPAIMPAHALNPAYDNGAMSEVGSQNQDGELGKFKSVKALMDAYDNLQAEFTKKCQQLSQMKSQVEEKEEGSLEKLPFKEEDETLAKEVCEDNPSNNEFSEEGLQEFISQFGEAKSYVEEIKNRFPSVKTQKTNPYVVAWAEVLMSNIKQNASSDPIINQYVLSDEKIRNKILEEYFISLKNSQPPIVISSQSGERLSGVLPDSPKTLADAKKIVGKMFS